MGMFCYQCQKTARNTGCTVKGVCGKNEEVAKLQDLLIYVCKVISDIIVKGRLGISELEDVNHEIIKSMFITITNAKFDAEAIEKNRKQRRMINAHLSFSAVSIYPYLSLSVTAIHKTFQ